MFRLTCYLLLFCAVGCITGCHSSDPPPPVGSPVAPLTTLPNFPTESKSISGVDRYDVSLGVPARDAGHNDRLNVYLPNPMPEGSLPCIFIAPAGATDFTGMRLTEADAAESIPYAQAGFVVVAYEIDGDLNVETVGQTEARDAFLAYERAQGGLVNAQHAIQYALEKVPQVDPERLYTVGHSSAGGRALFLAAHEPRIKGCAAFAPSVKTTPAETAEMVEQLTAMPFRFKEALRLLSASHYHSKIRCPTIVYHGTNDRVINTAYSETFVERVEIHNKDATYIPMPGLNHGSVLDEAIPMATQWLQKLSGTGEPQEPPQSAPES